MATTADLQAYAYQQAVANGLDPNVFLAQIGQESNWNPNAQNGNASGIAQFMPGTAAQFNVNTSDPYSSIAGAAKYDQTLLTAANGDYTQMLTSYGTLNANGTGSNAPGGTVWQKFQALITGASSSGTAYAGGIAAANNTNGSGACSFSNPSQCIAQYGASLLAIILGLLMVAGGTYGVVK